MNISQLELLLKLAFSAQHTLSDYLLVFGFKAIGFSCNVFFSKSVSMEFSYNDFKITVELDRFDCLMYVEICDLQWRPVKTFLIHKDTKF